MTTPRVPPVTAEEYRKIAEAVHGSSPPADAEKFNVMLTTARHPELVKARAPLLRHLVIESTLPARDRELVILRVGWRCQAPYEFGHHWQAASRIGITDAEVHRLVQGPDDPGWDAFEGGLLRAVDELLDDKFVSDDSWILLSEHYSQHQLMDFVYLVGLYTSTCMALNSFGVELEEGVPGFPPT